MFPGEAIEVVKTKKNIVRALTIIMTSSTIEEEKNLGKKFKKKQPA